MRRSMQLIALVGLACLIGAPRQTTGAKTSTFPTAKGFTLVDTTGRTRTLAELKGKVVVLSFWATWCGPCRMELPRLHDVYKRHKHEPLEVYAIAVDNAGTVALVPAIAEQMRLSFPVLLDTDNKVVRQYDQKGIIPYTVIVDQQGRIRHIHPGYTSGEETQVEQEIVNLLKEHAKSTKKSAPETAR